MGVRAGVIDGGRGSDGGHVIDGVIDGGRLFVGDWADNSILNVSSMEIGTKIQEPRRKKIARRIDVIDVGRLTRAGVIDVGVFLSAIGFCSGGASTKVSRQTPFIPASAVHISVSLHSAEVETIVA